VSFQVVPKIMYHYSIDYQKFTNNGMYIVVVKYLITLFGTLNTRIGGENVTENNPQTHGAHLP
jgi:hypothetical protein